MTASGTDWLLFAWAILAACVSNGILWSSALVVYAVKLKPSPPSPGPPPRVTLIRPFKGLEVDALEKNRSLLRQDHPGLEVLFICEDPEDPGVAAARAACAEAPDRARLLFSSGVPQVPSGKVRNMIAGWRASTSELVAFCDADIHLAPGDLSSCVGALADPEVGASWMFVLFEEGGVHGQLWKLMTGADGYPIMSAAARLGMHQSLQGGLMVLRRDALDAAGGIEQLGDTFADDVRAGFLLQRAGYKLRASERLLRHETPAEPLAEWALRFHRWTLCFRSEAPVGFFAQLLLNASAVPLLVALALADSALALPAVLLALGSIGLRTLGTAFVDLAILRPRGARVGWATLLRPLADLLFFTLSVTATVLPFVRWRGRWYRVGWNGRIVKELGRSLHVQGLHQ